MVAHIVSLIEDGGSSHLSEECSLCAAVVNRIHRHDAATEKVDQAIDPILPGWREGDAVVDVSGYYPPKRTPVRQGFWRTLWCVMRGERVYG